MVLLSGLVPMQVFGYHQLDSADSIIAPPKPDEGLDLLVTLDQPNVILSDNTTSVSFKLRLYEKYTNQTISHVTYLVALTGLNNDRPLLEDIFHSHQGPAALKFNLNGNNRIDIRGQRDPVYNAWLADELGVVNIDAPRSALEGAGLFRLNVAIIGFNNDAVAVEEEDAPKFEMYLGIGQAAIEKIKFMNSTYDIKVVSYFGRINEFRFDPDRKQFSWSIPFVWNPEYLDSTGRVFVHQEIYVPKTFAQFIGNYSDYGYPFATVNGKPLLSKQLAADPYTDNSTVIFHYLLNQRDISAMAAELSNSTETPDSMTFTLSSYSASVPEFSPLYVLPVTVAAVLAGMRMIKRRG